MKKIITLLMLLVCTTSYAGLTRPSWYQLDDVPTWIASLTASGVATLSGDIVFTNATQTLNAKTIGPVTMQGNIDMAGYYIENLADPTSYYEAANKGYVDQKIASEVASASFVASGTVATPSAAADIANKGYVDYVATNRGSDGAVAGNSPFYSSGIIAVSTSVAIISHQLANNDNATRSILFQLPMTLQVNFATAASDFFMYQTQESTVTGTQDRNIFRYTTTGIGDAYFSQNYSWIVNVSPNSVSTFTLKFDLSLDGSDTISQCVILGTNHNGFSYPYFWSDIGRQEP